SSKRDRARRWRRRAEPARRPDQNDGAGDAWGASLRDRLEQPTAVPEKELPACDPCQHRCLSMRFGSLVVGVVAASALAACGSVQSSGTDASGRGGGSGGDNHARGGNGGATAGAGGA